MQTRSDLVAIARDIQDEKYWIVKDPIRLNYFCYSDEAYFVLQGLNAQLPINELEESFEARFDQALSDEKLKSFLVLFVRDQVIGLGNGQDAGRLSSNSLATLKQGRLHWLKNPLAIRFPPWDFSSVFKKLRGLSDALVRPWFLGLIALMALVALAVVFKNWDEFQARLPAARDFFRQQNVLLILLCLGATKIVHEFGHALACRKFGAECQEIGVMFLLFSPCLYCDVSDAWMIQSKWKRILIAAAGILVEILVASIATIIWWFSEPGWLNNVCLNLMLICGVSTVFFNGNPLLRFDGYFIVSDLVGIPNLWNRSKERLKQFRERWLLGIRNAPDEFSRQTNEYSKHDSVLLVYGILSACYRYLLVFVILLMILEVLISLHFEIVGLLVVLLFGVQFLLVPAIGFARKTVSMSYHGKMKRSRFWGLWGFLVVIVVLFFFLPLPHRITVPGFIEYADVQRVYVRTPGILKSFQSYGVEIAPGELICELENPELASALKELQGENEQNRVRLESLNAIRDRNSQASDEIPAQIEKLQATGKKLDHAEERVAELATFSSRSGVLIPPYRNTDPETSRSTAPLPYWKDDPLSLSNVGAFFDKGELMALIGKPNQMEAFALVRQEKIDLIQPGQPARLLITNSASRVADGTVEEVTLLQEDQLPGDVATFLRENFSEELARGEMETGKLYLVRIILLDKFAGVQFEACKIRISVRSTTLATRLSRYFKRTFASLME